MSYKIDFSLASSGQIEIVICKRLEQIRLACNITQKQLAVQSGVSVKTISRMEKGAGISLNTFCSGSGAESGDLAACSLFTPF